MRKELQSKLGVSVIWHILLGAMFSLVIGLACLIAASFVISNGWLSEQLIPQITVIACVVGTFIGGSLVAIKYRTKQMALGAAVGVCLFFFLMSVGFLCYGEVDVENRGVLILLGCLCGGALSGVKQKLPKSKQKKSARRKASKRKHCAE